MTARKENGLQDTSREIANSLSAGDHLDLDKLSLRGIIGIVLLFLGCLLPRQQRQSNSKILFVLGNGVAHGARLGRSVQAALEPGVCTISDNRLVEASLKIDFDFPSLAVRSIWRIASIRGLRLAFSLRRHRPSNWRHRSWVYGEYLFLAQSIRFRAAQETLSTAGRETVVIADYDRGAYCLPWIFAANELGLCTATLVHGSPNEKGYLPLIAQNVFVWGEAQSQWFSARASEVSVHIVGRPDLDDAFAEETGAPRLYICHSRETLSSYEVTLIQLKIQEARALGIPVVFRAHPKDTIETVGPEWARLAGQCDEISDGERSLQSLLRKQDQLLVVSSSSAIDALALGVQVSIVADNDRHLPADLFVLRECDLDVSQASGGIDPFGFCVSLKGMAAKKQLVKAVRDIQALVNPMKGQY